MRNRKRNILLLSSAAVFAFAGIAFGQTEIQPIPGIVVPNIPEIRLDKNQKTPELRQGLRLKKQQAAQELKEGTAELREKTRTEIEELKNASRQERVLIQQKLKNQRDEVKGDIQELREQVKNDAQKLRQDFRKNITSVKNRARVAAAHGRGLRMLNRFRSAIVRFDHIIGRIDSRLKKLEERGVDISSVVPLLEEARNMKVEAEATFEELKTKYETLLKGENPKGTAGEAKDIALDLKGRIEKLHQKLKEIVQAVKTLVPASSGEETE